MLMKFHDLDDSFRTFETLRRGMNRWLLDDAFFGAPQGEPETHRALDIRETDNSYVLRAELPGLSEKDIDIQVDQGVVDIRAERKVKVPDGYKARHTERASYTFSRRVRLPSQVNDDDVHAVLKDGVLTVTLAKRPERQPQRINVTVG